MIVKIIEARPLGFPGGRASVIKHSSFFRSGALGFFDVVDEPFADFAGVVSFGAFGGDVLGHYFGIH